MKKSLWLALILILPLSARSQGWVNVDIPGLNETITGISFVSRDTGFVITAKGRLARTTDAAKTWDILSIAGNSALEDVYFVNGKTGFVCARSGLIFRTIDRGQSWSKWFSGDSLDYFSSIWMRDSVTGFVAGLQKKKENPMTSVAFRTTDGGKTWKSQTTLGMGYAQIISANRKLNLLSFGTLHTSTDNGATWISHPTTDGNPGRTVSIYGSAGIIGGLVGMRSYSIDSGKTWTLTKPDSSVMFIASQLVNEKNGYLGGAPSALFVTNDGGKTWGKELPARQFDILAFSLIDDRLYAVGANGGIVYKKVR